MRCPLRREPEAGGEEAPEQGPHLPTSPLHHRPPLSPSRRQRWLFKPAVGPEQGAHLPEAAVVSQLRGDPFVWQPVVSGPVGCCVNGWRWWCEWLACFCGDTVVSRSGGTPCFNP